MKQVMLKSNWYCKVKMENAYNNVSSMEILGDFL